MDGRDEEEVRVRDMRGLVHSVLELYAEDGAAPASTVQETENWVRT